MGLILDTSILVTAERRGSSIPEILAQVGNYIPFEDLLIGATALQLGFGVATENVRHFQAIPGLTVRQI